MHRLPAEERAALKALVQADHVSGEVLVKFKDDVNLSLQSAQDHELEVLESYQIPSRTTSTLQNSTILRVKTDEADMAQTLERLYLDERVETAFPNFRYETQGLPNDLQSDLWALPQISAPIAWQQSVGYRGPLIAVVDTGVDTQHPDLGANIWNNPNEVADGLDNDGNGVVDDIHGYNAVDHNSDLTDSNGHGTHVSGTIGAIGDNAEGVVGVNWQAQMMGVKIFGENGTTADAAIKGLLYAENMGARLTTNSWGGGPYSSLLKEVLGSTQAFHIAAAGNRGKNNDVKGFYPASHDVPNLLSVAATDQRDQLASFSNYGERTVDVAAPGVDIFSTLPDGQYGALSGTSMATPHVTGAAALALSIYPDMNNEELKTRLTWGVDHTPNLLGKTVSAGRLNMAKVIEHDTVSPAKVRNFQARVSGDNKLSVTWTNTGDDHEQGDPSAFDLRVLPEGQDFDFSQLPQLAFRPSLAGGGKLESHQISLMPSGKDRQLKLGLSLQDNLANRSDLAETTLRVPGVPVLFEDRADSLQASGDWRRVEVPGRGQVWTDTKDGTYERGERGELRSPKLTLKPGSQAKLHIELRHELEKFRDSIFLEVSRDGEEWDRLDKFTGEADWNQQVYSLADYAGDEIEFRFSTWTSVPEAKTAGLQLAGAVVTES